MEKNISISQQNLNFIIEDVRGQNNLKNELSKIESYSKFKKNINFEDILKLTNLAENYDISELVDNCLIKKQEKNN